MVMRQILMIAFITLSHWMEHRKSYNSLHGVVFFMSVTTGEVIDYVVRKNKILF